MVGIAVALFLCFVAITLALVCYALWSTWQRFELWEIRPFSAVYDAVVSALFVELLLVIPVLVALTIVATHRIVGPLARLTATLEQMGRGDFVVHLKLRRGDVLSELADSINRLAASLRHRR